MKRYYIRPAKKQQTFLRKTHITMKDRKRRFEILEELDDFDESFMFEEWGQRPAPKSKSRRKAPAAENRRRGSFGGQRTADGSRLSAKNNGTGTNNSRLSARSNNAGTNSPRLSAKNNGTGTNNSRLSARSNNAGTNSPRLSARSNNAGTQNRFAAKSGGQRVADDSTLTGKCLVYIGSGKNDLYKESVIYITDSSPESVKGIMINKLLFGSAVVECRNHEDGGEKDVRGVYEDLYQGGPVNPANGFVLFPSDGYFYSDPHARVQGEIAISSSFGVLQDILDGEGPDKKIIAMGHCVWKRGELEWEIFNNEWLIVPGDPKLIFDTRFEDRWEQAKKASGINLGGYIPHIGLA